MRHLLKVTQHGRGRNEPRTPYSYCPTPTKHSTFPTHCILLTTLAPVPGKRKRSKIHVQCPCVTAAVAELGSAQPHPHPVLNCPLLQLQGRPPGPRSALTLLRRRPPPWCSGVLVSDALLVFSLLLLGSLSLIMSYWRQKRAMTPGG